jgi:hypothetical protein
MPRNEPSDLYSDNDLDRKLVNQPDASHVVEMVRVGPVVQPWALRGSAWRPYFMAFLIAGGVFLMTTLLHFWISPPAENISMQPLADLAAALLVGLLAYRSYMRRRERMQLVYSRLHVVAETNHHVRNALEAITLRIYSTGDRKLINDVSSATRRIDWALREILGDGDDKPGKSGLS